MSRENDSIRFRTAETEYLWDPAGGSVTIISTTRESPLAEMGCRIIRSELARKQRELGGVHVPSTQILEAYFQDTPDAGDFKILEIIPVPEEELPEGAIE
jgi:hypothetical protein